MSKKHPGAGRVRRQRHDEDVFVESVLEGSVWAKQHGRTVLIVGIVAFLLLAGGIYYRNYRARLNDRANAELNQVRSTVLSGNKQLAATDLKNYIARFGKTPSGEEARTMLAQLYLSMNQPQQAVEAIQPITGNPDESPAPNFLLAGAYEALNQPDKAVQEYLKIADEARFGFEQREALERAAVLRAQRGDVAGAIQLYNRAIESLPEDSQDRPIYEMRIAELRGGAPAQS